MNKGGFLLGVGAGLIVLGFYVNMLIQSNREAQRTWKPNYEQLCVEDGNSQKNCLCAISFVEKSTPSAELSGEQIYENTKEIMKGICL